MDKSQDPGSGMNVPDPQLWYKNIIFLYQSLYILNMVPLLLHRREGSETVYLDLFPRGIQLQESDVSTGLKVNFHLHYLKNSFAIENNVD